jgi:ATP-dependent Clp protease ATP-binding subunit ClpA
MTSNAGAREMSSASIGFSANETDTRAGKGMKAVENLFSPEFRNRLDAIISFNGLSIDIMEKIVDKFIQEMETQLTEKKVRLELTPAARLWLAEKGYDAVFGARPLARLIQSEVKDILAEEILFGLLQEGGTVRIDRPEDFSSLGEEVVKSQNLTFKFVKSRNEPVKAKSAPTAAAPA